jgi:glycerol uptake facilitator-like aquaporin
MRGLPAWVVGEFVGTFILVFFGCGSVCAAVTTGAQVGVRFSANGLGWLTVYIIAPIIGGLLGGGTYGFFFQRPYRLFRHAVISEKE